jgi:hypothetical protein
VYIPYRLGGYDFQIFSFNGGAVIVLSGIVYINISDNDILFPQSHAKISKCE